MKRHKMSASAEMARMEREAGHAAKGKLGGKADPGLKGKGSHAAHHAAHCMPAKMRRGK